MPKSSKNRKSTSSNPLLKASNRLRIPFTPLRRFFFKLELLAPSPNVPVLLGKRRREEPPECEAGFQHLHAYDHSTPVEKELDSRQDNAEASSSAQINIYAPDGSRTWTNKPAGPRSLGNLRCHVPADTTSSKKGGLRSAAASPYTTPRSHRTRRRGPSRVALQNLDATLDDDAVIITTLENVPFDSHEDLLAMSREELVRAAQSLNAKLPHALSIDISDERPVSFIRNAIEVLVGICPEVPPAPLRMRLKRMSEDDDPRFFEEFSFENQQLEMDDTTPSATPLSMRAKPRDWSGNLHGMLPVPRRLERLDELTEEESSKEDSSWRKKRKLLSYEKESSLGLVSDMATKNSSKGTLILSHDFADFPVGESNQSRGASAVFSSSPSTLRSHSQKLVERTTNVIGLNTSPLTPSESKRNAKVKRKPRAKKSRQSSVRFRKPSTDDKQNSVTFPIINTSPTVLPSETPLSFSSPTESSSLGTTHSPDSIISSSTDKSLHPSNYSADKSESAFLSIKSAFSSRSKMSICTRSTKHSAATSKADVVSTEEPGSLVDMDISL